MNPCKRKKKNGKAHRPGCVGRRQHTRISARFSGGRYDTITATFRCRADFNGIDGITVQDIFEYLNGWFASNPATDVDGVPGLSVQDIFSFLNTWFAGC